ncbi:MAG: hypothetical protein ACUZ8N_08355 [Candidatus Scalindua sp.]
MKEKREKSQQVSVRLTGSEKESLARLAHQKGCEGLTGLLRLLARAKQVVIKEL